MNAFLTFLGDLTLIDWVLIGIAWLLVAFALGTFTGLGTALGDRREAASGRPPAESDDETWLDAWIFGETVPDFVPRSWVS